MAVNWRERYARYRRYGLDPLPADATDAQREAHIAQLRALRKQRQRKVALRSGLGTLALVVAAALLLYWLLMTIGGRDALLRQIVARLPAGSELTWKSAEGPASGPMTLHGVHFAMPRQRDPDCVPTKTASCAMGRIVFDADAVVVDPAIRPLLGKRLRLDALDVRGATLDLPRSDKPFELPKWPDVLPDIAPPLALQARAIRIDGLKLLQEGEALADIRSARGGLDASSGRLHVERLRVDSDRGVFTLHGDYAPREDYRSDLVATAVLPAPAGRTAPRLGLVAKGDLSRMDVALAGRAPAPLRATLTLRGDKDAPGWHLRANSEALDPSLLAGSGEASTPLAFDLVADGNGGNANLRGTVSRGDFHATLQPSKLSLQDRVLRAQPLVLDVFDGRVTANGHADLRDAEKAALKFAVNARGLQWRGADGKAQVRGDADFGLAGQFAQLLSDPTPGALIKAQAPNLARWIARMDSPRVEGAFVGLDAVRDAVVGLLREEVAVAYLQWMNANAHAVAIDAMAVNVEIAGVNFTQKPQRFAAKAFNELRRKRADVGDAALGALLEEAGCDAFLKSISAAPAELDSQEDDESGEGDDD